ncbi:MAG TPA: TIGR03752 family integrating conjugative element protein [Methylophaga aminisulfidivorans]|uniref:TIGR03752 family integrating conjugative element protein n=2 Tax=root TaxID=1 RepID=A0A7C1W3H1_9GAMM|nr:TIGR03752 family integrating conjugative element protein [Methylophaga sp.]HEC74275.1 TIGR03752 family integrating conjugative element protein [Methylophaga aminisulfidivorans]
MAEKRTNKLIPLIALGLLVILIAVVARTSDKEATKQVQQLGEQYVPDGDTTDDTLRTLTALVQEMREENDRLIAEQKQIKEQLANRPKENKDTKYSIDYLMDRVDELTNRQNENPPELNDFDMGIDIPDIQPQGDVWVEPIDTATTLDENGLTPTSFSPSNTLDKASDILGDTSPINNSIGQSITGSSNQESIIEPVYTVPKNSTLIGSTAMTALIGRVPINGSVEDPYPIKVIVGNENLTANGFELPEVNHMIFSGTATGDWTLSCVRADLTSVTYVFDDGTIQTLSVGDPELQNDNRSGNVNRLAWISDNRGIPCVSGKRISNAATFLAGSIFAKGVEAGAKAVADAETTRIVSSQGDTTSSVTGDALKNSAFESLSGGTSAISEWLQKRQQQSFDVIYVDTGSNVAVHIDAELPINYKPNGRKLRHARYSSKDINNRLD